MADAEVSVAPVLTEGELSEPIEDVLAAIDRKLLPDEVGRDPLVEWVYSWLKQTEPAAQRSSRRLSVSPVAEQFVVQTLGILIPFYLVTLRWIGLSWRSMEQLITQAQSALQDENLAASVRLTEQHLATLSDHSPAQELLLKAARETPDALRDTLREVLQGRLAIYIKRLDETRRAWRSWQGAVTTVKDSVDDFRTLAIYIDFGFAPQDPQALLDTIVPALNQPRELLAQLTALSLEESPFPEREVAALMPMLSDAIERAIIALRPDKTADMADYLVGMQGDLETPKVVSVYRDAVIQANRPWVLPGQDELILQIERETFRYLFTMREGPYSASAELKRWLADNESIRKAGFTQRVAARFSASRRESSALFGAILDTVRDLLAPGNAANLPRYSAFAMKPSNSSGGRPPAGKDRDESSRRSARGW